MARLASSKWQHISTGFVGGLFLAVVATLVLGNAMPLSPDTVNLKLSGPGGATAELRVEGGKISYKKMLEFMFADDILHPGVIGWLKAEHHLYSLEDPTLVGAIQGLCDPIPQEPLELRLQKAHECAEKELPSALRNLCLHHIAPFHPEAKEAKLGVPEDHRPKPGHANVCVDGPFFGKTLRLIDPASKRTQDVEATGYYVCTGFDNAPDLQLCPEDMTKLLMRPAQRIETILVVPL